MDLVSAQVGRPMKISAISKTVLRLAGLFSPFIRELVETVYQFERPFFADATKFQKVFGPFEPAPHEDAVARTVAWFRERGVS